MPIDSESFKSRDAGSYDGVAERFAYWTERVTTALARDLVERVQLKAGERVLDVGSGSGIVTFAAAQRVGATGRTVGIDLSEGMLRMARSKAVMPGSTEFLRMDAEHLEFAAGSFDAVLSLFALLHFPHPEIAVQEMFRVVRPGGRVAIGIGVDRKLSWINLGRLWSRFQESRHCLVAPKALDRFIASRLPHASEHETPAAPKPDPLNKLLYRAGFREIRQSSLSYTHKIETPDEFWDLQTTFSSMARKRLEGEPSEVAERLREEFLKRCVAVQEAGGQMIYRNGASVLAAVRP